METPEETGIHSDTSSRTDRTGWRPTETEAAFQSLLSRLAQATPAPMEDVPRPEYSGRQHEDPRAFLADLEDFLASRHITTDRRKVRMALSCLKDEALRRMEPLVALGLQWEEFRPRLLSFFDDDATRRRITLAYLGTEQKANESAEQFIRTKQLLANRVDARIPQTDLVQTIRDLLLPQIRLYLRGVKPTTVTALIEEATAVEEDLKRLPRTDPAPSRRSAPTPPTRDRDPGPRRDHDAAPPAANPQQERIPPQCWYCPERHFHRQCPVLRQRRAAENPHGPANQGNSRTAGTH